MRLRRRWIGALAAMLVAAAVQAAPLNRDQALDGLLHSEATARLAAVDRLAEIGSMADAGRVVERLADADPRVRTAAEAALWQIWGRSGDPAIDLLYAKGLAQMQASALDDALATFSEIVRRKPAFAEGWNKRATIYFLLGENEKSLRDCDEVFKRNPNHFGALAGAGQIHLLRGDLRQALDLFRRALQVNPNLSGPAQMVPLIEQKLQDDEKNRT
jgi:tetratricopeptide (TPR) repeat protein